MRGKKLYTSAKNWGCSDDERIGMLLFVQRLRELLLHTTSVPAKPSNVSCLAISREILVLLNQHSKTPHTSTEVNVRQLVDELNDSLSNDEIAREKIGDRWPHIKTTLQNFADAHAQIECAKYVLGRIDIKEYTASCTAKIIEIIGTGSRRKKGLLALCESFFGAIKEAGYPTQTIYHLLNVSFFDRERTRVTAQERLSEFFSNFDFVRHNYSVYFALTDIAANVASTFKSVGCEFAETDSAAYAIILGELTARETEFFVERAPEGIVSFQEIRALDPQSARVIAERRLRLLDDLLRFSVHGGRFVVRNQALVRKEKGNYFVHSNRPKAPIMLVPHDSDMEHTGLADLASALGRIRGGSAERFIRAIELHGTALSAQEDESQLLNIWIALETLFVTGRHGSKVKEIIETITPYVLAVWNQYIFGELWERIENIHNKLWLESISSSKELQAQSGLSQFTMAVAIKKFEPELTVFLGSLDDDPLFRQKICACIKWSQKAESVREYLAKVRTKIVSDINRIYRTRNQIVHTGGARTSTGDTVQLAHFYLDLALTLLSLMFGSDNGVKSIDQANLETKIRHDNFFIHLNAASGKHLECDSENYSTLLFGRSLLE